MTYPKGEFDVPEFARGTEPATNFGLPAGEPQFEVTLPGYLQFPRTEAQQELLDPSVEFSKLVKQIRQGYDTNDDAQIVMAEVRMRELVVARPELLGLLD